MFLEGCQCLVDEIVCSKNFLVGTAKNVRQSKNYGSKEKMSSVKKDINYGAWLLWRRFKNKHVNLTVSSAYYNGD